MGTLLALMGAVVLAGPGPQPPRLEVAESPTLASPNAINMGYWQVDGDPAPTRIRVHVPEAYGFTPSADGAAPGTTVGFDQIQLNPPIGDRPATGLLTMEDRTAFAGESLACTGSINEDAVWAAHIGSPSGVIRVPIFVNGHDFTVCPDATRLGGTMTYFALELGLLANANPRSLITGPKQQGTYTWSATVARAGAPTIEVRSVVDLPQRATFTASVNRGRVRITGRVTANGRGAGGLRIQADAVKRRTRGFEPAFFARTRGDGRFTITHRIGRGTFYVRVRAYRDPVTTSKCGGHSSAPGGCVSTTRNGFGLEALPAMVRIHS
ncbi:MAG: hypothetical protein QOG93_140 [Gaiellaceae bacterium]|jgi:hypothetical protein|nr:hypothetical protein [Gaiellaceae bacterium]